MQQPFIPFKSPKEQAYDEVYGKAKKILDAMDDDLAADLLAALVLDQVRQLINKFPSQQQQEIIAQLTDGFLVQWSAEENNEKYTD